MADNERARARNYDLFKGAVALVLLIIIIVLLLQGRTAPQDASPEAVELPVEAVDVPGIGEGLGTRPVRNVDEGVVQQGGRFPFPEVVFVRAERAARPEQAERDAEGDSEDPGADGDERPGRWLPSPKFHGERRGHGPERSHARQAYRGAGVRRGQARISLCRYVPAGTVSVTP